MHERSCPFRPRLYALIQNRQTLNPETQSNTDQVLTYRVHISVKLSQHCPSLRIQMFAKSLYVSTLAASSLAKEVRTDVLDIKFVPDTITADVGDVL